MSEKEILELENLSHIEQFDKILERRITAAIAPLIDAQNLFIKIVSGVMVVAVGIVGYIFVRQENISERLLEKATKTEMEKGFEKAEKSYLGKWEYYRAERFEHEKLKAAFIVPETAGSLLFEINENIISELGLGGTYRGETIKNE